MHVATNTRVGNGSEINVLLVFIDAFEELNRSRPNPAFATASVHNSSRISVLSFLARPLGSVGQSEVPIYDPISPEVSPPDRLSATPP